MRKRDMLGMAWDNLRKKKLRTFLTTSGVMIGVGALICMYAFGQGVQRNVKDQFDQLGLFDYIMVYRNEDSESNDPNTPKAMAPFNDQTLEMLMKIPGVEAAYPQLQFPAQVQVGGQKDFTMVQVLPEKALELDMLRVTHGQAYSPNEPNALIASDWMLQQLDLSQGADMLGETVVLRTLTLDFNPLRLIRSAFSREDLGLPVGREDYTFKLTGIFNSDGVGAPLIRSSIIITQRKAAQMKKLAINSLYDLFNPSTKADDVGSIMVKVTSPSKVDQVKEQLEQYNLSTFAWIDQLEEMKKGFLFMDLFLIAVGMIGTTVASLGIVNTMVMSVLERTREIGIMKAVGASDSDIHAIFLVESGLIGLLGGGMGLILAWLVAGLINLVVNAIGQEHGIPSMHYFAFPLWLCWAGMALSVGVSLFAGFIPTCRAASIDPVSALRHD